MRLEPSDEYMHPLEAASNFNESMYFNWCDPGERVGGFVRLGNRANEGYAEMTACVYLPDGPVAFTFRRPEITNNDSFDAGGMRFEIIEPFARQRVRYSGKICMLDRPLEMADPRTAFVENPWVECDLTLDYRALSPMLGGERVHDDGSPIVEDAERAFARGHYEQHVAARGTVRVGDQEWAVDGYGLRDHSWGPRYWQAPWWYRWLTGNFGADAGFMMSIITARDGSQTSGGVWFENGEYQQLDGVSIDTVWTGTDLYHEEIHAVAHVGNDERRIDGRVMSLIPLRNRRRSPDGEQFMTRISEGMTEWRCDGRTGYGLSEYLDQIIDGKPVGAMA